MMIWTTWLTVSSLSKEGKQKVRGIRHKIREEKERERRVGMGLVTILLVVIFSISGVYIHSTLTSQGGQSFDSTSGAKVALVDHLSLTAPNQIFIETIRYISGEAGFNVDYYPGEEVTVGFYRNLPSKRYEIIIFRVHSAAYAYEGKQFAEAPVCIFTSEAYSRSKYFYEQLTEQLVIASYTMPEGPYFFGIMPKFVSSGISGSFNDAIIIMMGCEGMNNTKMAEAFIRKGARAYIGWSAPVLASHTDQATTCLLEEIVLKKQTMRQAVENTMNEIGPDPVYKSKLIFYPP